MPLKPSGLAGARTFTHQKELKGISCASNDDILKIKRTFSIAFYLNIEETGLSCPVHDYWTDQVQAPDLKIGGRLDGRPIRHPSNCTWLFKSELLWNSVIDCIPWLVFIWCQTLYELISSTTSPNTSPLIITDRNLKAILFWVAVNRCIRDEMTSFNLGC